MRQKFEQVPARIEGDIAYITLTKGFETVIDAEDVPLVENYIWCVMIKSNTNYAVRNFQRSTVRLHRVIMNAPDGLLVDHINRNGLDNRKSNLRLCTQAENMRNSIISPRNNTGYKGVCWRVREQKYEAKIRVDKKSIYLGLFSNPVEAYEAYCKASEKYHKEFGRV